MQIHVGRDDRLLGIFTPEEVRVRLARGEFRASDLGWAEGRTDWAPLSTFTGLVPSAAPAAPPPLPLAQATARPPQAGVSGTSRHNPSQEYYPPGARAGRITSGAAIASLVCGILGMTLLPFLASIPAVICGHVAHGNIRRSRRQLKGRGLATAGLIMGYLSFVLISGAVAVPVFGAVQEKAKLTKSLAQGKQIAVACRQYAAEHDGRFPKRLEDLVPDHLPDARMLTCPLEPMVEIGYKYYGGKDSDPPTDILLVSKAAVTNRKNRVVIYVDSSGKVVRDMPNLPMQKSVLHLEAP